MNDCFERSLNGNAIDTTGYEMNSIVAYILWVGKDVKKGVKPRTSGITQLAFLDRAASPAKGKLYTGKNARIAMVPMAKDLKIKMVLVIPTRLCGANIVTMMVLVLFRLSRFAGYVKDNMPFNQATHEAPVLSDEEAWDVAAFVNSQPRPKGNLAKDWPNIAGKPIDHPFAPYADGFTENQHKYGPFQQIAAKQKDAGK